MMKNITTRDRILEILLFLRKHPDICSKKIPLRFKTLSDDFYLHELKSFVLDCTNTGVIDELQICIRIMQKIYIARNITLDGSTIENCLSDMDRYTKRFDDHNGQTSELDVRYQAWKIIRDLKEKYKV